MSECVTCGSMWASLCVRVNWACSNVSVLMCFSVFIHMSEFVSMFTCEWMYNHVHLCQILNVYICFWVIAWVYVYVWMLIICMYMTVNECTCEFVTRFTVCICALVHLCVQITVWVYTSDHVSVFEWKCKHVMYVHDYEWMYALYFCFSTFFLELMCKQVCQ